ncbi:hypothetical protein H6G20_09130 [Desertifilum sp. FACHB-1129]|uniref:Uncharacterized protein n=1 Tax=Desertifilum tharense IPPAS B-1220 TaxID=1781255 RepID=A0ACD5H0F3_9CYAN|nr:MULTISPECIES: hypothetical protein [Desertifilum]MBD2311819.1 hypothetical protein [Desertifilum sp. FACHB-1129]MBD2322963.1 hypothetical protein [Desertifilum sp. FACHB-866]MBD2333394.1 hypothetical protein [Desertifilum sp. FACHB-868]MDA0209165.1 hypothetical protein [Cyanobacteria bacterium FC1]
MYCYSLEALLALSQQRATTPLGIAITQNLNLKIDRLLRCDSPPQIAASQTISETQT